MSLLKYWGLKTNGNSRIALLNTAENLSTSDIYEALRELEDYHVRSEIYIRNNIILKQRLDAMEKMFAELQREKNISKSESI